MYSWFCAHSSVPMSYLVIEFFNCNLTFLLGNVKEWANEGHLITKDI